MLSRNNTHQRDRLNMLLRETRGEQKTSESGKDNSDGRGYPPGCSRLGMPRPYSPMGILGPSHGYVMQDPHPPLSEVRYDSWINHHQQKANVPLKQTADPDDGL